MPVASAAVALLLGSLAALLRRFCHLQLADQLLPQACVQGHSESWHLDRDARLAVVALRGVDLHGAHSRWLPGGGVH